MYLLSQHRTPVAKVTWVPSGGVHSIPHGKLHEVTPGSITIKPSVSRLYSSGIVTMGVSSRGFCTPRLLLID